ncbi:MAG TPA: RpiB/LacA/LacB family sugar-phosphate isomerase [Kofleriaceae bacterium]|jgi:ribose 5-phosphate isomerase B|nr:RpiB/LacA/LacB family sugar-phosphate isomerase [Kofleriaceae bacterium]
MKIALCADEPYPVHATLRRLIEQRGHTVEAYGAAATGADAPWADTAEAAAEAVARGVCDEGIFLCWSGTGISMAANKVHGVRAALVWDPGGAAAARVWNHANVLCLSHRTLSDDMAKEIVAAWFDTAPGDQGADGVARLRAVDDRHRR